MYDGIHMKEAKTRTLRIADLPRLHGEFQVTLRSTGEATP